jgi:hypothetical protein
LAVQKPPSPPSLPRPNPTLASRPHPSRTSSLPGVIRPSDRQDRVGAASVADELADLDLLGFAVEAVAFGLSLSRHACKGTAGEAGAGKARLTPSA